ncbi:bacteriocin immunity protein [Microbacterium karelineae]|uniref:bacteriocin immunity protein n=1 Tax=Microbacterium karelineae TaxID=2654283 RepID=UPI0018D2EF53|nr:bacteriocin immunity protein [Microbacterium karelineae]
MELRSALTPRSIPPNLLATLGAQANAIASLIEFARPYAEQLAAFNAAVGTEIDPTDLRGIHAAEDPQDFVRRVMNRPERVPDITREELIEIVDRISAADDSGDFYLELFEMNVPHPEASDLIFWPPEELQDASSAQIVDAALSYTPHETTG